MLVESVRGKRTKMKFPDPPRYNTRADKNVFVYIFVILMRCVRILYVYRYCVIVYLIVSANKAQKRKLNARDEFDIVVSVYLVRALYIYVCSIVVKSFWKYRSYVRDATRMREQRRERKKKKKNVLLTIRFSFARPLPENGSFD